MIKTILKSTSIALLFSTLYMSAESKNLSDDLYIRAGAGVQFSNAEFKGRVAPFDRKSPGPFPVFQIGVGYKLYKSVRADLLLQYAEVRYKGKSLSPFPATT